MSIASMGRFAQAHKPVLIRTTTLLCPTVASVAPAVLRALVAVVVVLAVVAVVTPGCQTSPVLSRMFPSVVQVAPQLPVQLLQVDR